ncbi:pantetheine-phosphate adenylyltransferase [Chlamydiota bacterium]
MKTYVVYPGTFDPVTFGHIDIVERSSKIFNQVIIAIAQNSFKKPLFTPDERKEMMSKALSHIHNVTIDSFEGLLIDYCKKKECKIVIRGLRAITDFEYEFQMALTNRKISDQFETVFMMPNEAYSYLSSKIIKEIVSLGGRISQFVPEFVEKKLQEKL